MQQHRFLLGRSVNRCIVRLFPDRRLPLAIRVAAAFDSILRAKRSLATGIVTAFALSLQGCFVLIPFIEPYEEPEFSGPQTSYSTYRMPPRPGKTARQSESSRYLNRYIVQLRDPKPTVRTAAASYIGMLGRDGEAGIAPLIGRLHDESKFVRRAVVKSLGKIGVRTPEVESALQQGMKDRDRYVRESAEKALARLQRVSARVDGASYVLRSDSRPKGP